MSTPMYCYAVDTVIYFSYSIKKLEILGHMEAATSFYRYRLCIVLDRYKYPIHKVE
jgi:hypothetical protein